MKNVIFIILEDKVNIIKHQVNNAMNVEIILVELLQHFLLLYCKYIYI